MSLPVRWDTCSVCMRETKCLNYNTRYPICPTCNAHRSRSAYEAKKAEQKKRKEAKR